MSQRQKYTTAQLILRSLTPSAANMFFCITVAFLLVGINIVLQSVDLGTALPGILDGQWAIFYTENVVQPLTQLLSSNTLNKFLIALLWGMAGFVVYVGFEYALHSMQSVRENRTNIRMARGNVIERPLANSFVQALVWRVVVLACGILFLILVQPLLHHALGVASSVLLSSNLSRDGLRVLGAIAEWAFVLHGFVVFLRLYTLRTRLFGDDKLY
jgi:hypothetical protein